MTQVTENIAKLSQILKQEQSGTSVYFPEFRHILDEIQISLDKQDSDGALMALVKWALQLHASDIHLELHETDSEVRFRIDGDLATVGTLKAKEHEMIIERMKYRSNLKLNIHDVPQDGKFRFWKEGHDAQIDVRVSVMPTRYGESIVCRILDSSVNVINFDGLGIIWPQKDIILSALKKKQGMVLVTGPTGSGKTTTLYTMIDALKTAEDKIITLEDPIEYQIPGVLQSEINERAGYTFALGVRSVLRHDPDIIMIGEIRDLDTANTAVQAALTGHLVLSTLHTKSAFETLERLENMGVGVFDVAASLDVIISQRLVRRICRHCATRETIPTLPGDDKLLKLYWATEPLTPRPHRV
jgi:type IV pilus assembly protein PilB